MTRPQFAGEHPGQDFPRAVEDRREVHGEHVVPAVVGKLDDRRDMLDARVVDQDIDLTECLRRERDQAADLRGVDQVGVTVPNVDVVLLGEPRRSSSIA